MNFRAWNHRETVGEPRKEDPSDHERSLRDGWLLSCGSGGFRVHHNCRSKLGVDVWCPLAAVSVCGADICPAVQQDFLGWDKISAQDYINRYRQAQRNQSQERATLRGALHGLNVSSELKIDATKVEITFDPQTGLETKDPSRLTAER